MRLSSFTRILPPVFVALLTLALGPTSARAAGAVMIWPVDPILDSQSKATAIWIENQSTDLVTLQIRVLGWREDGQQEHFDTQTQVIASPPIASIEPGKRQLVRIMRTVDVPAGVEAAFRVVLDEIPSATAAAAGTPQTSGITFRMRYSLPLFVYGAGLARPVASSPLAWHVVDDVDGRWLQARNDSATHVKVANAPQMVPAHIADSYAIPSGLLGYVLANSQMRWRLPDSPNERRAPGIAITN